MDQSMHARAIWSALDAMLEQDPEGYRRFVNEQLEEGRRMLRREGGSPRSGQSDQATVPSELEKAFSTMSLGNDRGSRPSTSGKRAEPIRNDAKNFQAEKIPSKDNEKKEDASGPCLLDDEIGKKSILAQIVKPDRCDSGNEDDVKLEGLEISATTTKKGSRSQNKKKPLIEEV